MLLRVVIPSTEERHQPLLSRIFPFQQFHGGIDAFNEAMALPGNDDDDNAYQERCRRSACQ
jgi:hypothetical protein